MEMFAVLLRSDPLIIDMGHVIDALYIVTSLRVQFNPFVMLRAHFDF